MTDSDRIAELEQRVEKLQRQLDEQRVKNQYQAAAEGRVVTRARIFAMAKVLRTRLTDHGATVTIHPHVYDTTIEMLQNNLIEAAESLLLEDAIAGGKYE